MKKVFIIILNFNGWEDSVECVESLEKLNLRKDISCEIVIVDNGSRNDSVARIRKRFPELTLIESKANLGFSGGCNLGIRYAQGKNADFVLLLNNDTMVHKDLIKNLINCAEESGAAVPKIYFAKGFEYHKEKYNPKDLGKVIWYAGGTMDFGNLIGQNVGVDEIDRGQFDEKKATDVATGCCLMLRSDVLKNAGLFDERYFLYYEDADLSERIKGTGYKIIYEPNAIVWHKNAESSGVGGDLHDYYITRNRLLFGMTYASVRTKIALVRESIKLLRSGRRWQKSGVLDFYLRKFGRGSFAA